MKRFHSCPVSQSGANTLSDFALWKPALKCSRHLIYSPEPGARDTQSQLENVQHVTRRVTAGDAFCTLILHSSSCAHSTVRKSAQTVRKWTPLSATAQDQLMLLIWNQAVRCGAPARRHSLPALPEALCFHADGFGWNYARFAVMETSKLIFIFVLLLSNVFSQEMDAHVWREGVEEVRLSIIF